jgi:glycosyltransferase involved in cell wall biosynthesis
LRILVVGEIPPWPPVSGGALRLANVLSGLSRVGEVDLFVLLNRHESVESPLGVEVARIGGVLRAKSGFWGTKRLAWLLWGRRPSKFVWRDEARVIAAFEGWAGVNYDLVWLSGIESYLLFGSRTTAPSVVDFYDIESRKVFAERAVTAGEGPPFLSRGWPHHGRLRLKAWKNQRRWQRLEQSVARATTAAVVASALDAERLGAPITYVVPNAYDLPDSPVGATKVRNPPTVLFQGTLGYAPNTDGARYLVRRIAPHLWNMIPNARIRLAGRGPEALFELQDPPRVVVEGNVPDMTSELAQADVVAVPLRFGGGTRLKILEAFAHRIPVVTTSLGAEGLDAVDGRHILIADEPERFAEKCVSLLTDQPLRQSIVNAAHDLFLEKYEAERVRELIRGAGEAVARGHDRLLEESRRGSLNV